jgi:hypothetical protein
VLLKIPPGGMDHGTFHATDIGDHRMLVQASGQALKNLRDGPERHGDHYDLGALNRTREIGARLIDDTELACAPQGHWVRVVSRHALSGALQGAGERSADETHADNGDA